MKINQLNNDELTIKNSGLGSIIVGVILVIVAIVGAVLVLIGTMKTPVPQSLLACVVILALAVALIFFASNRVTTLRRGGSSTIESKRLLGGASKSSSFETDSVVAVRLYTTIDTAANNTTADGMNRGQNTNNRRSELSLLLRDNSVIDLGSSSSSGGMNINGISSGMITKAPLSDEAKQIASFLGVKLQSNDSSNPIAFVRDMVKGLTGDKQSSANEPSVVPTNDEQHPPSNPTQ